MKRTEALFGILSITAALVVQVNAQTFLTNGLVAYYPFNGNANDASGNGHNGFVENATPAADRFGRTNGCYQFASSWIFVPYNPTLFPSNQTISIWLKNTGVYQSVCLMRAGNVYDDNGRGYGINTMDYNATFGVWDGDGSGGEPITALKMAVGQWPVNEWTQLVFTHQSNVAVLYLNGQAIISRTNATTYQPVHFSPLYIGSGEAQGKNGADTQPTDAPLSFWHGLLDDVRIYNRALSASEVQQLYVYESGPRVNLIKAVKPSFSNLTLTTNYQLQVSADLSTWTNQGSAFTATNTSMVYPQYWDVDNWNQLFFRLQLAP